MTADELNIAIEIRALRRAMEKTTEVTGKTLVFEQPAWEYRDLPFNPEKHTDSFNRMGAMGWELVQIVYSKEYAIFKRPKLGQPVQDDGGEVQHHECQIKKTFALKYAYNRESPKDSYHFIIDHDTGKVIRVSFCPWCGEAI